MAVPEGWFFEKRFRTVNDIKVVSESPVKVDGGWNHNNYVDKSRDANLRVSIRQSGGRLENFGALEYCEKNASDPSEA